MPVLVEPRVWCNCRIIIPKAVLVAIDGVQIECILEEDRRSRDRGWIHHEQ